MSMPKRSVVIRAALARYFAGERLRILSFVNDALDREGLRELDHEEEDTVMLSWSLDVLPYGAELMPQPAAKSSALDEMEEELAVPECAMR